MRVVTTNDFVGSFFPQETSWGRLPGGAALAAAVEALDGMWIDTGDFAQGSALGPRGFAAAAELGIDVAVVGNHELDWGLDQLRAQTLPFPLLAANLPGFSAVHTAGELAVIGVTLPGMADLHPGVETTPPDLVALARQLRADGSRWVIVALHDGIDAPGAMARMEAFCAPLRGAVDLVLGGHTLQCFAGELAGVPFLQPWAFGSQVGVADLGEEVTLRLVDVAEPRPWTGFGADAVSHEVVGRAREPLWSRGGASTLAAAIAAELLGEADAVYLGPGDLWNQPARDGLHAWLPAGDVTLSQVARLTPFTGGRSVWGGQLVAAPGAGDAVAALMARPAFPGGPPTGGTVAGSGTTVATTAFQAYHADRTLGRTHDWRPVASTLREALLAALTR